jgi:hypothetical protein
MRCRRSMAVITNRLSTLREKYRLAKDAPDGLEDLERNYDANNEVVHTTEAIYVRAIALCITHIIDDSERVVIDIEAMLKV